MQIRKKNINKIVTFFIFAHLIVWTLIPTISNTNLPLDTIEALAWSSNLDWGYNKHPPFSAWSVEFFYQIFGNQDWRNEIIKFNNRSLYFNEIDHEITSPDIVDQASSQ